MRIRTIEVREKVMARNDELAARVRSTLVGAGVPCLNLVSSPGSGKTLLLERTLEALGEELRIAVVTGDCQTRNDADRLAARTDRLVQAVVTGGACHLDARQLLTALDEIDLADTDLLFVENVGNLVCPASWDLGETAKVVIFSVPEGEDKPAKYPKMFRMARHAVLNKIDLLPHVPFDVERALGFAREVNPELDFFLTSALTGEGLDAWLEFLRARVAEAKRARPAPAAAGAAVAGTGESPGGARTLEGPEGAEARAPGAARASGAAPAAATRGGGG